MIFIFMDVLVNKQTKTEYKLIERIGSGTFADVYKGQNIKTNEIVAIKKMKNMKKADTEMAKRQIEVMKTLNHKNIVRFIDQFRFEGIWYIVLEYCGKGDLENYKKKVGKLPEYHCKLLVRGILEALVQLHTQNKQLNKKKIAHRDLKLPNILINDNYELKLADFGFSKDFEIGYMESFCGTPLTMAPQVLKRGQKYNEKCDVWSLGVITYYLLYNKYPYMPTKSDGTGLVGIENCVLKKQFVFDQKVQISEIGKDFVTQCLQKQVDKRPSSHQLLTHPWFNIQGSVRFSILRQDLICTSLQEKPEKDAFNLCKTMLFGIIQQHINKLLDTFLVTQSRLKANINLFKQIYENKDEILQYYLLITLKKIEQMTQKDIVIILENRSIKIEARKINKFIETYTTISSFIVNQAKRLKPNRPEYVNIQKQLVKFLLTQTDQLMEMYNQDQNSDKLRLLKDFLKTLIKEYQSSIINVKWGEKDNLANFGRFIVDFIIDVKDEQILTIINEEISNQDDLEPIWLIEHQIKENMKEKKNGSIQIELGRQLLYILNIPSNFIVEKQYLQNDRFQLEFDQT